VVAQIVDQLEVVHASNRIHNDLKLSNVMVKPDRHGKLNPILIDFGFASKFKDGSGTHFKEG
tara:strand:+ start:398 stop:583 length:186 start_codon:yes stop_codon:yes gene_type:complete